ncbi:MAG: hypothetical protein KGZ71_03535 [Desulfobulbaceae bacterium]|nr:hypothetical protein [Candidatus Kapabacteria bacterium]MBS3999535.1 hypothetical protein [Desulfobulbaceae bacterium]
MKKLMNILLLFALILIFESCSFFQKFDPGYWKAKSEFKKELEFVQKILDNPDKMQEIIEYSEYYDANNFELCSDSYLRYIKYLKPDDNGCEADILGFNRTTSTDGKGKILYENAKVVSVYKSGSYNRIVFVFFEEKDKIILGEICSVTI